MSGWPRGTPSTRTRTLKPLLLVSSPRRKIENSNVVGHERALAHRKLAVSQWAFTRLCLSATQMSPVMRSLPFRIGGTISERKRRSHQSQNTMIGSTNI